MVNDNYKEMMNALPLVQINGDWNKQLKRGQLIGFNGLGPEKGITAAYPVFDHHGGEIVFVLYTKDGKPVLDNDFIRDGYCMFTNADPIIVDIATGCPTTFQSELASYFK